MKIQSKPPKHSVSYGDVLAIANSVAAERAQKYGASWRLLRPSSLTDMLLIKINRSRTLLSRNAKVTTETIVDDMLACINYSAMALYTIRSGNTEPIKFNDALAETFNVHKLQETLESLHKLHEAKDHDYGSIWQSMEIESLIDIMLVKVARLKSLHRIVKATDHTIQDCYQDIANYAIFVVLKSDDALRDHIESYSLTVNTDIKIEPVDFVTDN